MSKVSQKVANVFISQAYNWTHTHPDYRFGQALFNILPERVTDPIRGTHMDFFHDTNNQRAIKKFFDFCVDTAL
jgi:hypothetical protein